MIHVNYGWRLAALALSTAALLACGSGPDAQPVSEGATATQPTTMPAAPGAGMKGMCPLAVEGTKVEMREVDGGAAIAFWTTSGDVEELRRRVHRMGGMHGEGKMMKGGGMMHGAKGGMGPMVPHSMKVEDADGGARVLLTPTDPAQLGALRERARGMAAKMGTGACPMRMMKQMGGGTVDPAEHEAHHPKGEPAP